MEEKNGATSEAGDWRSYERVLLPPVRDLHRLDVYEQNGGYEALREVLTSDKWDPTSVTNEVRNSGLRGRGGAGFLTGLKWTFMPPVDPNIPRFLCGNGDESEPGTFKDRQLMEFNPHLIFEGMLIASYAMSIKTSYLYVRGEFADWISHMEVELAKAYEKGYVGKNVLGTDFSTDLIIHKGAGAYICGEESSLMISLEGQRPYPRAKPPFPAQRGLWNYPTTINNVETLCAVPHIVSNGGDWYRQYGTEKSPGTKLFCVSGHVNKPGNYELPLGFPLIELIEDVCGGMRDGNALKAVIPGGSSVPLINAEEARACKLDYEGCVEVGTMLGCASVIVMDETADIVKQVRRMVDFYAHESCGQCTPCREGTSWTAQILKRIENGKGTEDDLDTLMEMTENMVGTTICVLSDSVAAPVQSSIEKFRDEYLALIRRGERVAVA